MPRIIKIVSASLSLLLMIQSAWGFEEVADSTAQARVKGAVDTRYIIDPETGQLSMYIRVWGEVNAAGVKIVPSDTDLIALLGFFGGPTNYAKLDNVRIIRYQVKPGEPRVVVANIEKFLETGDTSLIPTIYPNDTVIIKSSIWKVLRDISPYLSVTVQALNFIYLISRIKATGL